VLFARVVALIRACRALSCALFCMLSVRCFTQCRVSSSVIRMGRTLFTRVVRTSGPRRRRVVRVVVDLFVSSSSCSCRHASFMFFVHAIFVCRTPCRTSFARCQHANSRVVRVCYPCCSRVFRVCLSSTPFSRIACRSCAILNCLFIITRVG
jgi:hypothetical protein